MIKNRTKPLPITAICDNCEKKFPYIDVIRTMKGKRFCIDCYMELNKNDYI